MRTLYIIRGLPGSGKSTLAKLLTDFEYCTDYAREELNDGAYIFKPEETALAHEMCQAAVEMNMIWGENVIAVHNTFVKRWEMEAYYIMARIHGYTVCEVVCRGNFESTHDVPPEVIERMRADWED